VPPPCSPANYRLEGVAAAIAQPDDERGLAVASFDAFADIPVGHFEWGFNHGRPRGDQEESTESID